MTDVDSGAFDIPILIPVAPAYISVLAPYQVRALSGAFAPTNGKSTLRSVTPAIWLGSGVVNDNIMTPWSGGPKLLTGTRMRVVGGGHADSGNNGVYAFDFAGSAAPTGWILEKISANPSSIVDDSNTYSDGLPSSVHTYGGVCAVGGIMYRCGGSREGNGSFGNGFFKFDPATNAWTTLTSPPFGSGGSLIGDATAGKIIWMGRYGGAGTSYAFYRIALGTWSAEKFVTSQFPSDGDCAYRPLTTTTGTMLQCGSDGAFSLAVDWTAETLTSMTARSLGALGSQGGPLVFYDVAQDKFWGMGGSTYNALLEINPSTYAVTSHPLTGDAITNNESGNYRGHFGRFVFLAAYRALGLAVSRTGDTYVIRLP